MENVKFPIMDSSYTTCMKPFENAVSKRVDNGVKSPTPVIEA